MKKYNGDTIEVDLTVHCDGLQFGPILIYEVYTSIQDHSQVLEALMAKRAGWV